MNHFSVLGLCFLFGIGISHGRLNESELDLSQRFGPPTMKAKDGPFGSRHLRYSHDSWVIQAWFINGECHQISYAKSGVARPTEAQMKALYDSNGEGHSWKYETNKHSMANLLFPNITMHLMVRDDENVFCQKTSNGATFQSTYWNMAEREELEKRDTAKKKTPNF